MFVAIHRVEYQLYGSALLLAVCNSHIFCVRAVRHRRVSVETQDTLSALINGLLS